MHWDYDKKLDIQKYFGFVYCITNTKTKKAYIGCKQYWTYRKGKKKKESNWKVYVGSSKHLKEDIDKFGKDTFKFKILGQFKNKRSLKYYECYHQVIRHVLTAKLEGTDEPAYYNNWIGGKFYRPVQDFNEDE
jgi:hypothetical protein